ncbi:MAG: hypothetical protein QM763_03130 [Agriterribacter sp.]
MSFWKSVLNVINPLPAIINANKVEGQSFGNKLLNVFNPAQSLIKENSGLTSLQLSSEVKALNSGGSVLTDAEIASAAAGVIPADVAAVLASNSDTVTAVPATTTDDNSNYMLFGLVAVVLIFMFKK